MLQSRRKIRNIVMLHVALFKDRNFSLVADAVKVTALVLKHLRKIRCKF